VIPSTKQNLNSMSHCLALYAQFCARLYLLFIFSSLCLGTEVASSRGVCIFASTFSLLQLWLCMISACSDGRSAFFFGLLYERVFDFFATVEGRDEDEEGAAGN
jgi:hypothetical protein